MRLAELVLGGGTGIAATLGVPNEGSTFVGAGEHRSEQQGPEGPSVNLSIALAILYAGTFGKGLCEATSGQWQRYHAAPF